MTITWIEALAALTALGLFAYLGYALRPKISEGLPCKCCKTLFS